MINDVEESSSRGAVLLALESIGKINFEKLRTPKSKEFKSDKKWHDNYRKGRERHLNAYRELTDLKQREGQQLEKLLLERLRFGTAIEFDINVVRAEFAKRLRRKKVSKIQAPKFPD